MKKHNKMFDPWYSSIRFLLKIFFRTFYRFRVFGQHHIPAEGVFIAANHTSYYDPPLISIACPCPVYFLADEFLFKNRLFGYLIKKLHAYSINGSIKDVTTFKIVKNLLSENKKIVFFPEGGLSKTGRLQRFKPGLAWLALSSGTAVIPTYIDGVFDAWPTQRRLPRFGHTITCVFGEPISMAKYAGFEKKEAMQLLTSDIYSAIEGLRARHESHES